MSEATDLAARLRTVTLLGAPHEIRCAADMLESMLHELAALKAENERLREALQLLLDHGYDGEGRNLSAMALARRALGEEEGR